MKQLLPTELAEWLADDARPQPILLDVREPWEYELCHLAGSRHMPMHLVPLHSQELTPENDVVVICHHGARSMQVAMFLERQGFASVHNLTGGVDRWAAEVDASLRRY